MDADAEADADAEPDVRGFRDGGFEREICEGGGVCVGVCACGCACACECECEDDIGGGGGIRRRAWLVALLLLPLPVECALVEATGVSTGEVIREPAGEVGEEVNPRPVTVLLEEDVGRIGADAVEVMDVGADTRGLGR